MGSAAQLAALGAFMAEHALHPVIDRTFGFEEAPRAPEYLRGGSHVGKVVIAGPTVGSFFA